MVSPSAFFLPSRGLPPNSGHSPREFAVPALLLTVICSLPWLRPQGVGELSEGIRTVKHNCPKQRDVAAEVAQEEGQGLYRGSSHWSEEHREQPWHPSRQ